MGKIILTESELISLIKRIIKENYNKPKSINNWGCFLFDENTVQRDFCSFSERQIKGSKKLKEVVKDQIYEISNLIKDSVPDIVKFYTEEDPYFEENRQNLKILEEKLSYCNNTKNTIKKFIDEKIKNNFIFVSKNNDGNYVYDEINFLSTNYSALSYLLTEFKYRKKLDNYSFNDVFKLYFEDNYNGGPNKFNDSQFYNFLGNFLLASTSSLVDENTKEIMKNLRETIKATRSAGQKFENEVYEELVSHVGGKHNVINFTGDGSWVDLLGVDMIYKDETGIWIPVQVKSNFNDCASNKKFCINACVGKDRKDRNGFKTVYYN